MKITGSNFAGKIMLQWQKVQEEVRGKKDGRREGRVVEGRVVEGRGRTGGKNGGGEKKRGEEEETKRLPEFSVFIKNDRVKQQWGNVTVGKGLGRPILKSLH